MINLAEKTEIDALNKRILALENGAIKNFLVPVQLFGPVQSQGSCTASYCDVWTFPGSAMSASTKTFDFHLDYPEARWVRWFTVWIPNGAKMRLVHFDDNLTNVVEMAVMTNPATSPVPTGLDITDSFNALVNKKIKKNIGFQLCDDGRPWTIYEVRLEINYTLMQ